MTPTLSGAENGSVRPYRMVPGGVWIFEKDGDDHKMVNRTACLRIVRQRDMIRCEDYARQYLSQRGDKQVIGGTWQGVAAIFWLHLALVSPDGLPQAPARPIYPLPMEIADKEGKLSMQQAVLLSLWDLADGQLERLVREYGILLSTETPPALTHEEWSRILEESKKKYLPTLISEFGCSKLIAVLHGTPDAAWQA